MCVPNNDENHLVPSMTSTPKQHVKRIATNRRYACHSDEKSLIPGQTTQEYPQDPQRANVLQQA